MSTNNVSYRVTFTHGWYKVDDLDQLAEYLGREDNRGIVGEVKRIVKVESTDLELPAFVEEHNEYVRNHGGKNDGKRTS